MRIFILDNEKITKFNLPEKVSGSYSIDYVPVKSKINCSVTIESENGSWLLKSNSRVSVIDQANSPLESIKLVEHNYYRLFVSGKDNNVGLYVLPSFDNKYSRFKVNSNHITIGSDKSCDLSYVSSLVLANQLEINKTEEGWLITATESDKSIAYLNGKAFKSAILKIGDVIFLYGLKIIWMESFIQISQPPNDLYIRNFSVVPFQENDGYDNTVFDPVSDEEKAVELYDEDEYFFHSMRLRKTLEKETILIEGPPNKKEDQEPPLIATIGSSLLMLSMSFFMGFNSISGLINGTKDIGTELPSLIMCIMMLLGSMVFPSIARKIQKRKDIKLEEKRQKEYTNYLEDKKKEIGSILEKQTDILSHNYPAPSELYSVALNANVNNIWNRTLKDDDFLTVRVGMGDTNALLDIQAPTEHFTLEEDNLVNDAINLAQGSTMLTNVPITVSLVEKKISSIIANPTYKDTFLKSFFLQLLSFFSAEDLKLVFMLKEDDELYEFAKFAPHCFSPDKTVRFYSTNEDDAKSLSSFLENIIDERKAIKKSNSSDNNNPSNERDALFQPYYLIITNDYGNLKSLPIMKEILQTSTNLGFSLNIIDDSIHNLPNECSSIIHVMEDKKGELIENNANNRQYFNADILQSYKLRDVVNNFANIPIAEETLESKLPTMISFLEMYNVSKIQQFNIANRWKNNVPIDELKVPVGVHTSGELFYLDLHEKAHGPHGLIAGSTGSGKSEFIITYILSMCINYDPREVQFVLIDYKGGGLAGAFENKEQNWVVPHVVGTITNLDTTEMYRSLVSINSELKRRQKVFNDAKNITGESTIDIYKYQRYYRDGILKEPISHLFIISDEFAELKKQQPDFMDELISTARIGRALGVHLILATQKPAGIVNDQIWSNSKFKVCLKVQDRGDSQEVLKKPDAASLKEAGRFYLQVGYDEYFDIGQSAWAGAKYIPTDTVVKEIDDSIRFINSTGNIIKNITDVPVKTNVIDRGDQLTNIVKYLVNISNEESFNIKKLWLDRIPEKIYLGNIMKKYNYKSAPYFINPVIGEYDNPANQEQNILTLNITNYNTLLYGTNDSGKEDFITTLIYSCIVKHSPDELNMYILDFGSETLRQFAKAPQVGDVCTMDDQDKIINLLVMLDKEMDARKNLFMDFGGNYINYIKNSGKKLPLITIIINNYSVFEETMPKVADTFKILYRDGLNYGISVVISAGASNSFGYRLSELFYNKLCLQMPNDDDYRMLLNSRRGLVPSKCKGRGITGIGYLRFEFQTAFITTEDKLVNTIRDTIKTLQETYKKEAPRIPVLPETVSVDKIVESLRGLIKVPIGIDVSTKLPAIYNFKDDKITTIIYQNLEENINFFASLCNIVKKVENSNVRVVDFYRVLDTSKLPVECYQDNFNNIFRALISEVTSGIAPDIHRIYLIIGISKFGDLNAIQTLLTNIKDKDNTTLILAENYEDYKKFQLNSWFRSLINKDRGIWLGDNVLEQTIFDTSTLENEIDNISDIAYIIDTDKVIAFKKVMKDRDDDNEQ